MFLHLEHAGIDVFKISKLLVIEIYKVTTVFPKEEKYIFVQQLRRAAISVHLNISEGCSRKSAAERKRYFEIARGSVIEVDTALSISIDLNFISETDLKNVKQPLVSSFKQLSALIRSSQNNE